MPPRIDATVIAFSSAGEAIRSLQALYLTCCDLYGNADGDWVDNIAGQLGENGNICADPLFCDPNGDEATIDSDSPCLAGHHPDGSECGLIGARGVGCPAAWVAGDAAVDWGFTVTEPEPNPSRAWTRIRFFAPFSSDRTFVRLAVYDPEGRPVRTRAVVPGPVAGAGAVLWDGTDDSGTQVPCGVYFLKLEWNGQSVTRSTVRLR